MARWWEAPKLWRSEEEVGERRVGFLDLFFDLIFVVAIAQIAHGLAKHPEEWGTFVMLLLPVFWVWVGHTYYADRFENRDISYIAYTFLCMLPVVGMAVFAHDGRGDTAMGFIYSYAAARLLLAFMWGRGAVHNQPGRRVWTYLALGFTFGALVWILSAHVPEPYRVTLQIIGLGTDMVLPLFLSKGYKSLPSFGDGRLKERFGLIMIIVLGESVAGTVNGLAEIHHLTWRHGLTAGLGMMFAFGVYFTYFEMVPRNRLQPMKIGILLRTYMHFPLILAITATGAGVLATVGHETEALAGEIRALIGLGVGIAYVVLVGLSRLHLYPEVGGGRAKTEGALWLAALAAFAIGIFAEGWTSLQVLAGLAIASAVPWLTGVHAWRGHTKHLAKQGEDPTPGTES